MRDYHNAPEKPGDIGDPVADNIRAEQNRDAAPTAEEARQKHRDHLRKKGCKVDGCDVTDPDKLKRQMPVSHDCPAIQSPPMPEPDIVCHDHARPASERRAEQAQQKADSADLPVVLYECGIMTTATEPEQDEVMARHGVSPPQPEIDVAHVCGAHIDAVHYPEEEGED